MQLVGLIASWALRITLGLVLGAFALIAFGTAGYCLNVEKDTKGVLIFGTAAAFFGVGAVWVLFGSDD